jgi:hypothetical protein
LVLVPFAFAFWFHFPRFGFFGFVSFGFVSLDLGFCGFVSFGCGTLDFVSFGFVSFGFVSFGLLINGVLVQCQSRVSSSPIMRLKQKYKIQRVSMSK